MPKQKGHMLIPRANLRLETPLVIARNAPMNQSVPLFVKVTSSDESGQTQQTKRPRMRCPARTKLIQILVDQFDSQIAMLVKLM